MEIAELNNKSMLGVQRSHLRCKHMNVEKDLIYSKKILTGFELNKKLEEKKEIIVIATPFMNMIYNFVKGSQFFAILTDEEGCILNVLGDKTILNEAFKIKMIPGAYMDEKNIGTNAMSMVLTEHSPVQISGEEHYINAYHGWTCSCAPIKDTNGKVIATLDLTGYKENVHPHTLGMVVAAVHAIEKTLENKRNNEVLAITNEHIKTVFNNIPGGIITTNLSGTIIATNNTIEEMLGIKHSALIDLKIWDIVEGWQDILDTLYSKGTFLDEDIYINARKNKLQFNASAYPIYNNDKRIQEIIFIFQELKKVRKLAGKISSGRAIYTFDKIIGEDEEFLKVISFCKKIANSKSTILIMGESGTGKEIIAQSIHNHSNRNEEPFIAVNCGAIPRNLIESELFGYEEGSFTGAKRGGSAGKFELADGGTIFLDEIGEMPLDMQIKLLRVIEERVINRIGGGKPIPVNVRIIAATNKDLKQEVQKGNFRKDLFYRLNVLPVYLPPLRTRKEDISLLIEFFMKTISKTLNKRPVNIPEEYLNYLKNYNWPGNIRELENVVELIINTESIPMDLDSKRNIKPQTDSVDVYAENEYLKLEHIEKQHIVKVLKKYKGSISLSAKVLGIGRNTLYRKLEKYEIDCANIKQSSKMEQEYI